MGCYGGRVDTNYINEILWVKKGDLMYTVTSQKYNHLWTHDFTVIGNTLFPMDMLRYDRCFPRDGEAVSNIGLNPLAELLVGSKVDARKLREVRLIHYSGDENWEPTVGRWSSFLWSVKNLDGRWS